MLSRKQLACISLISTFFHEKPSGKSLWREAAIRIGSLSEPSFVGPVLDSGGLYIGGLVLGRKILIIERKVTRGCLSPVMDATG
jgi:hypothetical protein